MLTVLLAFLAAMLVVIPGLDPSYEDIRTLFYFMCASGGATIGFAYLLYRTQVLQRFSSLRWTLIFVILLTVLLIFVNVFLTAQLMYINDHDLILTTGLLIFGGIVSAVSVFFIARAIITRIHALAMAAEKLAAGNLRTRLPEYGNDELAELSRTFNVMAQALQTVDEQKRLLEQQRRDLIAWVSHDLRTPIAAIRAMNEAVLDGVVTDAGTVTRYLETMQREIENLTRLIDDLFELSKLDTGHLTIRREPTSISDLISDTLGSLAARAEQQQIILTGRVETGAELASIAADKVQRVLNNLLDNALQHTPPGGKITLHACLQGSAIRIGVHNTGSTISPADLPYLFQSFYRGETARVPKSDGQRGAGLGLAIARGFVEAHGGQMEVESSETAGTTFWFTLPV